MSMLLRAMLLRAMLVFAMVACSSRTTPAPEPVTRYPIVPDAVVSQLGDIGFALAIDLRSVRGTAIDSLVPPSLACARDILRMAKIAVVTKGVETWEGRLIGVAETSARKCMTSIANTLGVTVTPNANHTTTIALSDKPAIVTWRRDEAVVAEQGARVRAGDPPGVITDLLANVPRTAAGWLVTSGIPAQKVKSAVAWLIATPTTWTFTVMAQSTEMDAAKPWIDNIVRGFTSVAEAAQVQVDPAWFAIEATPTTATLVAAIPLAAFVPTR